MVRRWHALPYEENLTPGLRAFPSLTWILDVSKLLPIYVQLGEFASPFRTFVRLPSPICGFPWAGVVCLMHALTTDEIGRLSPEERLALIGELWDSLDDSDIPLTPAQTAELERRLQSFESERDKGVTWEALKIELRQRRS